MTHIHYGDLQNANKIMVEKFENYEKLARSIVGKVIEGISKYLGCDQQNIRWLEYIEIAEENKKEEYIKNDIREFTYDRRLILYNNGYYKFTLRINFPSGGIEVRILIKIKDDRLLLKIGDQKYEINLQNQEEFDKFIEELCKSALEFMENRFDDFINENNKKSLGFVPST